MKTLYTNGRIYTGSPALSEAFIVEDGKFTHVGTAAELSGVPADKFGVFHVLRRKTVQRLPEIF